MFVNGKLSRPDKFRIIERFCWQNQNVWSLFAYGLMRGRLIPFRDAQMLKNDYFFKKKKQSFLP